MLALSNPLPRDQAQTTCTDRNCQHLVSPTDAIWRSSHWKRTRSELSYWVCDQYAVIPTVVRSSAPIAIHRSEWGPPYTTQTKPPTPSLDTWTAGLELDQSFSTNSVYLDQFLPFFSRFFSLYISLCSLCLEIRDPHFCPRKLDFKGGWTVFFPKPSLSITTPARPN